MQIHIKLRNPPNSEFALRLIVVEPFKEIPPLCLQPTVLLAAELFEYVLVGTA